MKGFFSLDLHTKKPIIFDFSQILPGSGRRVDTRCQRFISTYYQQINSLSPAVEITQLLPKGVKNGIRPIRAPRDYRENLLITINCRCYILLL